MREVSAVAGSVFKRCGCVDARNRPIWRTCALLPDRGHGTWAYRIDLGPGVTPDGEFQQRRQRYRSGYATKREAEVALAAVVVAGNSGERLEASRMTVEIFLREWLDGKVNLRPSTRASYERYLERYFIPHIGHVPLRQLRARDLELMYAQIRQGSGRGVRRRKAVSPATIARVHATLKGALNLAVRRKQLPYNPALGVELETVRRPPARRGVGAPLAGRRPSRSPAHRAAAGRRRWRALRRPTQDSKWGAPPGRPGPRHRPTAYPASSPAARAPRGRRADRSGRRPRIHRPPRTRDQPRARNPPVQGDRGAGRTTREAAARPAARLRVAAARGRRRHRGRLEAVGALDDHPHRGHLQPPAARRRRGRGGTPAPPETRTCRWERRLGDLNPGWD